MRHAPEHRRVAVEEILSLRHRILRAGLPFETARFEGDLDASTRHYAAFEDGTPVNCLTLVASTWNGRPAWQLRGMATETAWQRRGIGREALEAALADAGRDEPDRIAWCNARTSAIGFYERLGWRVASEPFDVPTAGPHVKMVLDAPAGQGRRAADDRDSGGSIPPAAAARAAGFIVLELAFLAAAHVLGGPTWVALGVVACVAQACAEFRAAALVPLFPAIFWAAAHRVTGDRELFFPFAMFLSAHAAGQFAARGRPAAGLAGGAIVAAFLAIRTAQRATLGVLAVELAVAFVILAAVVAIGPAAARRPAAAVAVSVLASLAAYLGLAL